MRDEARMSEREVKTKFLGACCWGSIRSSDMELENGGRVWWWSAV